MCNPGVLSDDLDMTEIAGLKSQSFFRLVSSSGSDSGTHYLCGLQPEWTTLQAYFYKSYSNPSCGRKSFEVTFRGL